MIFIKIYFIFQSEYNFFNIALKIGCAEDHMVPFGHDTWIVFITEKYIKYLFLKSKAFIQYPVFLPWFSSALCGGKGKHCQELLLVFIYIKHNMLLCTHTSACTHYVQYPVLSFLLTTIILLPNHYSGSNGNSPVEPRKNSNPVLTQQEVLLNSLKSLTGHDTTQHASAW